MDIHRRASVTGLAAALSFPATYTLAGLLRPGYSPVRQYVSELAIGPLWWLQAANFVACGLLWAACGVALARTLPPGRRGQLPAALLLVAGAGLVATGLVPIVAPGRPPAIPMQQEIHTVASWVFVWASIAACIALVPALHGHRPRAALWCAGHAAALVPLAAIYWWGAAGPLAPIVGVPQRALFGLLCLWLAGLSLSLGHRRPHQYPSSAATAAA